MKNDVGDGNGKIKYEDFQNLIAGRLKETDTEEDLLDAFKVFDKNNNGMVKAEELEKAMKTYLPENEVVLMIAEAKPDAKGMINYVELVGKIMEEEKPKKTTTTKAPAKKKK